MERIDMDLVPSDSRWLIARALDLNIRTADRFFSPQRHRENQAFNRKVRKGGAKVAKNVTFANMINFATFADFLCDLCG
jgi:hypothetical protein